MSDQRFEKFTKEAKQALVVAQEKSRESGLNYVGTEHLLIGILSQAHSLGASILMNFGVSLDNVYLVLKTVGRAPVGQSTGKEGGFSGFAKHVIEDALKCAHEFNHGFVGTEHLLYALCSQENTAATVILENMKINPQSIKEQIVQVFRRNQETQGAAGQKAQAGQMNPLEFFLSGLHGVLVGQEKDYKDAYKHKAGEQKSKTPALDYFTTDLVQECRRGKIDPVVGRKKEIERMVSVLNRKTKNNPVLIGEPGVGKTAVVEGLAHAIIAEQVPDTLLDKKILSLSMASLVAGTKYRGEFEERVKQIIDEANSQTNVILFIDELHTVIGAGSAEGSLDAANLLKPALARGKLQVIGATTTADYRKHIESDPALERRFQPVIVDEPSVEETMEILRGIKKTYEDHHNLIIEDSSLMAAVTLSKRYINDRFLPDKAIDLMDEAAALKRVKSTKSNPDAARKVQQELSDVIKKKEQAVSDQNYEVAAELRCKELELSRKIEETRRVNVPREKRESVKEDDIARVVSNMTGVPVTRLVKTDIDKLKNLETLLKTRIVGQEDSIIAVAKAIRRSRAGISDERRPIASFIFMGPTGVGKTELVKALAQEVYNDEKALIKIDMSEFMERHNTSRLTGTTAGYVGYEDGGSLTQAVRSKPYSVILFDEIEKAHPDVFNLLLQILEDGMITDGKGRKIDFRNTIIVMTSNIGAKKLTEKAGPVGFNIASTELKKAEDEYKELTQSVMDELKDYFKPEFLNRVDKIVMFKPLTHENIKEIVKLHVKQLEKRLIDKKITLDLTNPALEYLAKESFDPKYGARPVRRKLQDLIEDPLTHKFLDGVFGEGDAVRINFKKAVGIELVKARKASV